MPDRATRPGQSSNEGCPFFVSRRLSKREREALSLAAQGLTTSAIALRLFVSECTAKRHLAAAREKLGAQNTTHAVAIAMARQVITFNTVTAG
jgi:DNA-binding CsgD family transcriptional regulator